MGKSKIFLIKINLNYIKLILIDRYSRMNNEVYSCIECDYNFA